MRLKAIRAWLCAMPVAVAAMHDVLAEASWPEQACNGTAVSHVIADDRLPGGLHAQAMWLERGLIRWPQRERGGRFVLHHAADRPLSVAADGRVHGSTDSWTLIPVSDDEAERGAARLPHVHGGVLLALPPDARDRIAALLRGQLLLEHLDGADRSLAFTFTQTAGALDDLYATAAADVALGATTRADGTGFALWAPTARRVALCLYADDDSDASAPLPMHRDDATGIWHHHAAGDLGGHYYTYLVQVWTRGHGLVVNRVGDPYALSLGADSRRGYVADMDAHHLKPAGWDAHARPAAAEAATDQVIYELHVRDFSIGDDRVRPAWRGRYLAFTEPGSRGMAHLRELAQAGVTDVHLLPVFDLATVPERGCLTPGIDGARDGERQQAIVAEHAQRDCYNWGYDPLYFNAPEGSYATDPGDGAARIREFRAMVMALHAAGLRVGMDVVYNHTSAAGQDARSVLDRIVPGYYHRLDADGAVTTSTCCANTATEHAMMARLMIDSAVAWVRHYGIDGFRFDLMGHQPRAAMERLQRAVDTAAGRRVHLLGEGWNFGEVADGARFVQAAQLSLAGGGIATFSDRARDAARGGAAADNGIDLVRNQGWLNGLFHTPNAHARGRHTRDDLLRAADLIRVGLAGSLRDYTMQVHTGNLRELSAIDYAGQPAGYVAEPGEVVNYVENHDNHTLFDISALRLPADTPIEERARVQVLGTALVAFSQGVAYLHAGQEILRSKSLDRNSYDSGDWFNRLDWSLRDNGFGAGLPPAGENRVAWPWMKPLLAEAAIKPGPAQIAWTRDATLDLLRIRASSSLFRLRRAEDVRHRLRMLDTGPDQIGSLVAAHLDGRDHPGARFAELIYAINADAVSHSLPLRGERGRDWRLHPVHRQPDAADRRAAKDAAFDSRRGRFTIPARTAVVFVIEDDA